MPENLSAPEHRDDDEHPEVISRNARYGLLLFIPYTLIYAAFVALSAFAPKVIAMPVLGGVNLSVVYGVGLIVLAFVLAMIYTWLCARARRSNGNNGGRE